jgi:hypothetical protein
MLKRRRGLFTGLFLVLWGSPVLLNNLGRPRVAALHGSDILGLIGCGMLFGVGLSWLIAGLWIGRSKQDDA